MITLSEYLGFIFVEITNARVMADKESARIAEMYSKNPLMEKFSVPRFKIPEMELSIPVVVSGAKFTNTLEFIDTIVEFDKVIMDEISTSINKLQIKRSNLNSDFQIISNPDLFKPFKVKKPISPHGSVGVQDTSDKDIIEFYEDMRDPGNLSHPNEIATLNYARVFNRIFEEKKLLGVYKDTYPKNELFQESVASILAYINSRTIVSKTKIENLLVSPETNIIQEEASDLSVFNIKAKITEEGIFVKTVRDKDNKVIKADVDFE